MTLLSDGRLRPGRRSWFPAAFLAALAAVACLHDSGRPCGAGYIETAEGFCACPAGFAPVAGTARCAPCGANEIVVAAACVCAPGFARASAGAPCEVEGLGAACDTAGAPCPSQTFPTCHAVQGTAGYCTVTGCAAAQGCAGGFTCDESVAPSYCKRPPVGQGRPCASSADCAGTEATYCESFQLKQCLVEGCAPQGDDCSAGHTCCDLSRLGLAKTLCLPVSACP